MHGVVAAVVLDDVQALALTLFHLRPNDQDREGLISRSLGVTIHADGDAVSTVYSTFERIRSISDLTLKIPVFYSGIDAFENRPISELAEVGKDRFSLALKLIGEVLHVVRTSERIGHIGHAGFRRNDLLRTQR